MILLQKKYIIKLDKKINDNISEIATFWPLSVKFISEHRQRKYVDILPETLSTINSKGKTHQNWNKNSTFQIHI